MMMVTIQTCDNCERISCNFHHAHQCPGILWGRWLRGHGENSNMDWRKEHTSTSTAYEYIYIDFQYAPCHHINYISFGVTFCFIGMGKHHCQYFYLHQH